MTKLSYEHEQFIIKKLACDFSPEKIADAIREKFLLEVSAEDVIRYHPEHEQEDALPDRLYTLFYETRAEFVADQEDEKEPAYVPVAATEALDDQGTLCVEKRGKELALFKQDGDYYVLDNTCTHQGAPLCDGYLEEGEIECPWHGARFDVTTGEATAPPAMEGVTRYNLRIRDNQIEVEL